MADSIGPIYRQRNWGSETEDLFEGSLCAHFAWCRTFASIFVSLSSKSLGGRARIGHDMTCLPACLCNHPSIRAPMHWTAIQKNVELGIRRPISCEPWTSHFLWVRFFICKMEALFFHRIKERMWPKLGALGNCLLNLNFEFCSKVNPRIILETTFLVNKKKHQFSNRF